jgi:pimeloyl-ACP methyl ester carboxylesterase
MPNPVQSFGGATQLALDCAGGVLRAVEQMHAAVARGVGLRPPFPGMSSDASGTVAGRVYALLQSTHGAFANAVTRSVRSLATIPSLSTEDAPGSVHSAAILNGICGDHLEATQNPLAIEMGFRTLDGPVELTPAGIAGAYARVSPHIAVWVHGLCLTEQHWVRHGDRAMGLRLYDELDITPVYVRYNSGRHVSINGRELSDRLERMIDAWPIPVEKLTLIGHSMGGLVIRSAGWSGDRHGRAWRDKLRNVVCLGTPHQGVPLEKGGELVTRLMQTSHYLNPLAFGQARSDGIKDLRHGNLLDEDWQNPVYGADGGARRVAVPLLAGVDHYFAAATIGKSANDPLGHILGDLLVRTDSAIGTHSDERRRLAVPPENCHIFTNMNHFDLLGHPQVYRQLLRWLKPDSSGRRSATAKVFASRQ